MPLQPIPTAEKHLVDLPLASSDREIEGSPKTHLYQVIAVDEAILYAEALSARKQSYLTWIRHRCGRDEL